MTNSNKEANTTDLISREEVIYQLDLYWHPRTNEALKAMINEIPATQSTAPLSGEITRLMEGLKRIKAASNERSDEYVERLGAIDIIIDELLNPKQ